MAEWVKCELRRFHEDRKDLSHEEIAWCLMLQSIYRIGRPVVGKGMCAGCPFPGPIAAVRAVLADADSIEGYLSAGTVEMAGAALAAVEACKR